MSPIWQDGAVCLLPHTGQTVAVSPFAAEVLSLLQRRQNLGLDAIIDSFESSREHDDMSAEDLRQAINNCLSEFERLQIVSPDAL